MFSQAIIDSTTTRPEFPTAMPVEAPVSDSKADEGVTYANLPHPLKEGTVIRCVAIRAGWTRHTVGKDYVVDANGNTKDNKGDTPPLGWGRHGSGTKFIIVEDVTPTPAPALEVGDRVAMSTAGRFEFFNEPCNPHSETGVILDIRDRVFSDLPFIVKWDNGNRNSYKAEHLVLLDKAEVETTPTKRDSSEFVWRELTDEEKAELLLAHHEGKRIQHFRIGTGWINTPEPCFLPTLRYRVYTKEMEEAERKEEVAKEISDLRSKIADLEETLH